MTPLPGMGLMSVVPTRVTTSGPSPPSSSATRVVSDVPDPRGPLGRSPICPDLSSVSTRPLIKSHSVLNGGFSSTV